MNFTAGEYIYINKPYRMTSFGALAYVRTRVSKKVGVKRVKMGHAGTLDPLATGVLILCTGKKTKAAIGCHNAQLRHGARGGCYLSYGTHHP